MSKYLERSIDKATQEVLKQAEKDSMQVAWIGWNRCSRNVVLEN